MTERTTGAASAESALTGLAGAAAGALAGGLIDVAVPLAVVAGANGLISGWRGTYDWRRLRGVVAFGLDSTWAAATTFAGLVSHLAGAARRRPGYIEQLSRRQNRHVYERGLQPRTGFAITFGNVVSGAGDLSRERRARLITDHEDVHVWQARWFGPLYPILYVGWAAGGAVIGALVWALRRRRERFGKVVESCAYYLNPFEWWAYSRDDHWPPSGLVSHFGWRRPVVRPLADVRRRAPEHVRPAR